MEDAARTWLEVQTELVRRALARFVFAATDEAAFQDQVVDALARHGIVCEREVTQGSGRFDIVLRGSLGMIVVELKVKGSPAAVERQAQRYAMDAAVDAVLVVTTSQRLAASISTGTLPGPARVGADTIRKPFEAIAVRTK